MTLNTQVRSINLFTTRSQFNLIQAPDAHRSLNVSSFFQDSQEQETHTHKKKKTVCPVHFCLGLFLLKERGEVGKVILPPSWSREP